MKEETFEGIGGLKIFFRSWRPEGQPRGVVVLVHGFKSHSGLYEWPAMQLVRYTSVPSAAGCSGAPPGSALPHRDSPLRRPLG